MLGRLVCKVSGNAGELKAGNTDGVFHAEQSVFRKQAIGLLAQDQPDGGFVGFMAQLVINHAAIKAHFSGVFVFEKVPQRVSLCAAPIGSQPLFVPQAVAQIPDRHIRGKEPACV